MKNFSFSFLRKIALTVLLLAAAGSLYFVINAGRHNNSVMLRGLFIIWVLSPFIAFLVADTISKRWAFFTSKKLYWLMLVVAPGSIVSYSGAFNTPQTKTAFVFLIVPLISWMLLIIAILTTRKLSGKINNTH